MLWHDGHGWNHQNYRLLNLKSKIMNSFVWEKKNQHHACRCDFDSWACWSYLVQKLLLIYCLPWGRRVCVVWVEINPLTKSWKIHCWPPLMQNFIPILNMAFDSSEWALAPTKPCVLYNKIVYARIFMLLNWGQMGVGKDFSQIIFINWIKVIKTLIFHAIQDSFDHQE